MSAPRFFRRVAACTVLALLAWGHTAAVQGQAGAPAAPAAPAAGAAASTGTALTITGDVSMPLTLTVADLKAMPRARVEVKEDGRTVVYEGVSLGELLKRAGAPVGQALRGTALTTYVLAAARDGYQVVYSLAELDPAFTSNDAIVADAIDGKPLFDYQGPLRLLMPKDTRPARAVRMLERLQVVRLQK